MKISEDKKSYYVCSSCNITTLTPNRMCPCPRGGCEAEIKGKIKTETYLELDEN